MLGIPLVAGRDFNDHDRRGGGDVVIVSQSIAQRLFPNGNSLNRQLWSTELRGSRAPARIIGVVADVDDVNVVRAAAMTIYRPTWVCRTASLYARRAIRTGSSRR